MTAAPDLSEFKRQKKCLVSRWWETNLSADELETLGAAFDSTLTVGAIFLWLCDRGYEFSEQSVWRHRVGRCPCRPRRTEQKVAAA
jgi:hypothetical protein